jgi:DNA-binding GntR family transcriptional regulator
VPRLTARIATSDDVAELGVKPGTAFLQGENWCFDHNGTTIEDSEDTTAGDRRRTDDYRASR